MRKKFILLVLVLSSAIMVGCGKEGNLRSNTNIEEMQGYIEIKPPSETKEVDYSVLGEVDVVPTPTPTPKPIAKPTEQVGVIEPSVSPEEVVLKGAEERDNLKSTYADIDLSVLETDISFEDYPWFILQDGLNEFDYPTYQVIVCAIDAYYGGEVTGSYTCNIATDIVSSETNMVFSVKVTGTESSLLVGLNMYEYTASVEVIE